MNSVDVFNHTNELFLMFLFVSLCLQRIRYMFCAFLIWICIYATCCRLVFNTLGTIWELASESLILKHVFFQSNIHMMFNICFVLFFYIKIRVSYIENGTYKSVICMSQRIANTMFYFIFSVINKHYKCVFNKTYNEKWILLFQLFIPFF